MTTKMENPEARARANRVPEIAAIAKPLDIWNPIEPPFEFQSELLAVVTVMRRFGIGYHHAQVVCQHSRLGGRAA